MLLWAAYSNLNKITQCVKLSDSECCIWILEELLMEIKGKFADREKGVNFIENTLKNFKVGKAETAQAVNLADHAIFHIMR